MPGDKSLKVTRFVRGFALIRSAPRSRKLHGIVLAMLAIPLAPLQAQTTDERLVEVLLVADGEDREWVYAIPESALNKAPTWDPAQGDPPLSVSKAVQIAQKEVRPENSDSKYILSSIQLGAVHGRERAAWYYMIEFYESTPWPTWPSSKSVLVLLDGTVLPPTSRPRTVGRAYEEAQ